MFVPLIFNGGVYRHEELENLVEDLGGYVILKNFAQTEVTMFIIVPEEDVDRVREMVEVLKGELKEAPLAGSEIAVVVPTISIHHLPHPSCDVAEYLRRKGAKSNMVGLSRGVGKRLARLTGFEKELINEHDVAVFMFGNFKHCILEKLKIIKDITVPVVVTGYPRIEVEGMRYVSNFGRFVGKFSRESEIELLEKVAKAVEKCVEEKKRELGEIEIPPYYIKAEIERQIPEVSEALSPAPITVKLDGVRVKLPYEKYGEKIRKVKILDSRIEEFCDVYPSVVEGQTIVKLVT
ncbi:MAG: methanogenesis marker 7 protein [Archaeoglobales archaeon]|nr:methanogenesis marker 7 protein [Archaeoglobales archaeon]